MLELALTIFGAYLLGSVSPSYVAGKWLKGVDLRGYNTGNLGTTAVYRSVTKWAAVPVIIFDIAKGALPVLLVRYVFGFSPGEYMLVGLATVVGHIWPVFLRFSGGRGAATTGGVLMAGAETVLGIYLGSFLVGVLVFRESALMPALAVVTLPLWAYLFQEPPGVIFGCIGLAFLLGLRRLLGNTHEVIPSGKWREVVFNRLLFDRDTRERVMPVPVGAHGAGQEGHQPRE